MVSALQFEGDLSLDAPNFRPANEVFDVDGEYMDEEDSMYSSDGATSEGNSRIWKDVRGILMISFAVFACVVLFIIGIISYPT